MFVTGAGGDVVAIGSPYQNEVGETMLAGRTPAAMAVAEKQNLLCVTNAESGDDACVQTTVPPSAWPKRVTPSTVMSCARPSGPMRKRTPAQPAMCSASDSGDSGMDVVWMGCGVRSNGPVPAGASQGVRGFGCGNGGNGCGRGGTTATLAVAAC